MSMGVSMQFDEMLNSEQVEKLHQWDDVDVRPESHHHTLGPGPNQSAGGSHMHRGGDSLPLLSSVTISGSRGGITALPSIISALVALGAVDTTSP